MDDHAAMRCPFGEIAVAPDILETLEIGGVVFLAVGIVPESDRHRGEGPGADELALLLPDRTRLVVPDVDGHAEPRRLDLARPDRLDRHAEHEAAHDVGAAGDRGEVHVAS